MVDRASISRFAERLRNITPERRRASLENDLLRQSISNEQFKRTQQERQFDAQEQLFGLLSGSATQQPSFGVLNTPSGAPEAPPPPSPEQLIGLLGRAAPEQATAALAQSLLNPQQGQERAEPADIRTLRAIGIDPTSPEGREIILGRLQENGSTSDEALRNVELQLKLLQIEDVRRERAQTETTAARERVGLQRAAVSTLRDAEELAQLTDELEGTFLETGLPASDLRRTTSAGFAAALDGLGIDQSDKREIIGKFDRFKKLSTSFAIDAIDRFAATGAVSQSKFQALIDSTVNIGASPSANRAILADVIETTLDAAATEGIRVSNERELLRTLRKLRERSASAPLGSQGQGETGFEFVGFEDGQ